MGALGAHGQLKFMEAMLGKDDCEATGGARLARGFALAKPFVQIDQVSFDVAFALHFNARAMVPRLCLHVFRHLVSEVARVSC